MAERRSETGRHGLRQSARLRAAGIGSLGATLSFAACLSGLMPAPLAAQSLPSDAMLTRTFAERGSDFLSAPLKALKVATLDLPPALGNGLGFTLPETSVLPVAPVVPPPGEDSYAYPPPLVLGAPTQTAAATPPESDAAEKAQIEVEADTPAIFGPRPEAARNVYLELALDSLLSLPNIDDEVVADEDIGTQFGPDITGADIPEPAPPNRMADAGGIGSDALFPVQPDDQGWADLGADAPASGTDGPIYRDPTVVFGADPDIFPAQPFEHATLSIPGSLVPLPVSAPASRAGDNPLLGGKGELAGGLAGPTFAERLGLEGPARARAEKCLAEAIYFESRGEAKRGQIAVAQVVMNRVFSGYYPNDVCKTVYQNAHRHLACQFTFACDDVKDVVREPDMWVQAKQISADMLDGKLWLDSVGRATHYHAYWVHPSWVREMRKLDRIGVHTFYRPKRWNG
ncbi:hydrolase [Azorhizobium oxalatiphilum]|uniref:Hydrolase n=1 Tax=Azorhizobium oxalatiphilum TaxID=980631 RepID=A0A917C108_9HYPH|nr:cell wall hydrolase [Azorhizobium oxalatiphilum]GGF65323.1 hydrolase [Azorhizobium oxalatiphilum]